MGIRDSEKTGDNWRMENKEIRLANLKILIAGFGTVTEFADKVGTDRNYLFQILSAKTKACVGTRLARSIEAAFDLPRGWMDQIHNELTEMQRMYIKLFGDLPPELQEQALEYMRFLSKQHGKPAQEEPAESGEPKKPAKKPPQK